MRYDQMQPEHRVSSDEHDGPLPGRHHLRACRCGKINAFVHAVMAVDGALPESKPAGQDCLGQRHPKADVQKKGSLRGKEPRPRVEREAETPGLGVDADMHRRGGRILEPGRQQQIQVISRLVRHEHAGYGRNDDGLASRERAWPANAVQGCQGLVWQGQPRRKRVQVLAASRRPQAEEQVGIGIGQLLRTVSLRYRVLNLPEYKIRQGQTVDALIRGGRRCAGLNRHKTHAEYGQNSAHAAHGVSRRRRRLVATRYMVAAAMPHSTRAV